MPPKTAPSRSPLRVIIPGLLALIIAVCLWLIFRSPAIQPAAASASTRPDEPTIRYGDAPLVRREPHSIPAPAAQPPSGEEPPPIIDQIIVEKKEVCSGEENLITVIAHTPNGTDEHLHYAIGSGTGMQVPVRIRLDDDGKPQERTISVFGRNNVATTVDIPPFTVKDCEPYRAVYVTAGLRPNTEGEFGFQAKIMEVGAKKDPDPKPFVPVAFVWDFGNDKTMTTHEPEAVHDYSKRPQDTMFSHYLVKVEVRGEDGTVLVGRTGLELLNGAFEDLYYKRIVDLLTEKTPRFPKANEDGVVEQTVHIWHHRPDPVTITEIMVLRYDTRGEHGSKESADVVRTLGTNMIPPTGIDTKLEFDPRADKDTSYVIYWLRGLSAEGYQVRGQITMMPASEAPTKENHQPVHDPVLTAKIKEARRILGKDFVTDEEIWKLEREGRFDELEVDYNAVPKPPAVPPGEAPGP